MNLQVKNDWDQVLEISNHGIVQYIPCGKPSLSTTQIRPIR